MRTITHVTIFSTMAINYILHQLLAKHSSAALHASIFLLNDIYSSK